MTNKFAFAGFRHGHIFDVLAAVRDRDDCQVVAACEEDAHSRDQLRADGQVDVTHDSFQKMIEEVECDIVAVGDYYAKRGPLLIQALEAGKHVLADKPPCTSLDELDRIEQLSAEKGLVVGCQLDLRRSGAFSTMRELIHAGRIGEVHTVAISAQHPLLPGSRPEWYFQPGCHGGVINDIGIHAVDGLAWLTGRTIEQIVAGVVWNAHVPRHPHFQDCGQVMFRMDNGGCMWLDVSYLAPDKCGYTLPQYWRTTCHGSNGFVETNVTADSVTVVTNQDEAPVTVPASPQRERTYLLDFLAQVADRQADVSLSTEAVLRASRKALLAQKAADEGLRDLPC